MQKQRVTSDLPTEKVDDCAASPPPDLPVGIIARAVWRSLEPLPPKLSLKDLNSFSVWLSSSKASFTAHQWDYLFSQLDNSSVAAAVIELWASGGDGLWRYAQAYLDQIVMVYQRGDTPVDTLEILTEAHSLGFTS